MDMGDLEKRIDKLEDKLEQRDKEIYKRINNVTRDFGAQVTRLQTSSDARCSRHMAEQNKQFTEIAQQLGSISAQLASKPTQKDVTQTKINIEQIKAEQKQLEERQRELKRLEKDSLPPPSLLDSKRFLSSPWHKALLGLITAATAALTAWAATGF